MNEIGWVGSILKQPTTAMQVIGPCLSHEYKIDQLILI